MWPDFGMFLDEMQEAVGATESLDIASDSVAPMRTHAAQQKRVKDHIMLMCSMGTLFKQRSSV